jgi:hypothetical protein
MHRIPSGSTVSTACETRGPAGAEAKSLAALTTRLREPAQRHVKAYTCRWAQEEIAI